jgi:hypothetical protein
MVRYYYPAKVVAILTDHPAQVAAVHYYYPVKASVVLGYHPA